MMRYDTTPALCVSKSCEDIYPLCTGFAWSSNSWAATSMAPVPSDLPRTMARIRRLVRENPNDRELQRLLHTLLTSMSSDKIDTEAVRDVLAQMEERSRVAKESPSHMSSLASPTHSELRESLMSVTSIAKTPATTSAAKPPHNASGLSGVSRAASF